MTQTTQTQTQTQKQTQGFAKPAWVRNPNCVLTLGKVLQDGTRVSFDSNKEHLESNLEKAKSVYRNIIKGGSGDEQILGVANLWSQVLLKNVEVDASYGVKKVRNEIDKARQEAGKAYITFELADRLEEENKLTTTAWVAYAWRCCEIKLCEDGTNSLWLTPAETVLACAELAAGKIPDLLQGMLGNITKYIPEKMKSNIELEKKLAALKEKTEPTADDVIRFIDKKVQDDITKYAVLMSYKNGGLDMLHQHMLALEQQLNLGLPTELDKFKTALKAK